MRRILLGCDIWTGGAGKAYLGFSLGLGDTENGYPMRFPTCCLTLSFCDPSRAR